MNREEVIEVLRLSEPMQKTHSLMETAIFIAKRESYLTDEEEATLREAVELAIQALEQTNKIADIVDGTIDHFEHDDAMDMLYEIKGVIK